MKLPRLNISSSIHSKLTFYVMLTVLVVFCVITVLLTNLTRKVLLESSERNAMNSMEMANQYINNVLMNVETAVENTVPDITNNLNNPDKLYEVVDEILKGNTTIVGSAIAFEPYYFPDKGEMFSPYAYRMYNDSIRTIQLGTSEYQYLYMDWYVIPKLLKKNYWSEPYYDSGGGEQAMITYSRPIYGNSGQLIAILTADVSLKWLTEMVSKSDIILNNRLSGEETDTANVVLNQQFLAKHAYSFIIGRSATYITHPMSERILNDTYFTFSLETRDSLDAQIGYNMIDGLSGMAILNRNGVDLAICYAPIERTGWSMGTVIPAEMIFGRAYVVTLIIVLIMLVGLIVLFFICNSIMKRITRPLVRFTKSADEIAKGNLDASLPDITTKDEMKRLHLSFQTMQTSLKNQMKELEHTTAMKTAIESELRVASDIQMSMLPKIFPPYPDRDDIDIFGQLTPAKAVGGDLFDFFIRDEKLFFCIGDVSGKGVPAALVMAVTRAQFRTVSAQESLPDRIVNRLNDTMCQGNDSNMFVTLLVGVLDLPTGRLRYCNAGHDAPLLIGAGVGVLPCDSNLPIGVMGDWQFKYQEAQIFPMTTIFLFTDGLSEAENVHHEQFSENRIMELAKSCLSDSLHNPNELINAMSKSVRTFVDGADQSDDLTMLAIQYTKPQVEVRFRNYLVLTNDIAEIPKLEEFVSDACERVGFDMATTSSINLAIEEAVVNVMNYAYPSGTKGPINIEAQFNDLRLKFTITDKGVPFDPTLVAEADITLSAEDRSIGGLGIFLVRKFMDSVNYERVDNSNVLTLRKKVNH